MLSLVHFLLFSPLDLFLPLLWVHFTSMDSHPGGGHETLIAKHAPNTKKYIRKEPTSNQCIHLLVRFLPRMGTHMAVKGHLAREPLSTEGTLHFCLLLDLLVCMHCLYVLSDCGE